MNEQDKKALEELEKVAKAAAEKLRQTFQQDTADKLLLLTGYVTGLAYRLEGKMK